MKYKLDYELFVDGAWASGTAGKRIDVFDPSSGRVLGTVADAELEDAQRAVDAAWRAADEWAHYPARARAEILRRCYELMVRDHEDLARLIALENGKALPDARGEVTYASEFFRWFAEEAVRGAGSYGAAPGTQDDRIVVTYQPIGVSLLITPWNFPAAMATRKLAPALAAGCTCILKPATETPLTAYAIASLMAEAGVPRGVVNVITTSQTSPVVRAVMEDDRVRKLSFTGSTEVGRTLLRNAAERVINCSMELGGNAPALIFDDADMDKAVDGIMLAKMRNGGEACTAVNRIYVQKDSHDAFVGQLTKRIQALVLGNATDDRTECGPLINDAASQHLRRLIDDAVERGATLTCGGSVTSSNPRMFPPTVLADVPANSTILDEEIFGPVAAIVPFDTEEEAITAANNTPYGLVAYVFTEDMRKAMRVSERIDAGMVGINKGVVSDPAAPFGGVKQSGLGREGGHVGMFEFMEAKYIALSCDD